MHEYNATLLAQKKVDGKRVLSFDSHCITELPKSSTTFGKPPLKIHPPPSSIDCLALYIDIYIYMKSLIQGQKVQKMSSCPDGPVRVSACVRELEN